MNAMQPIEDLQQFWNATAEAFFALAAEVARAAQAYIDALYEVVVLCEPKTTGG